LTDSLRADMCGLYVVTTAPSLSSCIP